MTIPYLPGWGDELRNTLPQLGENLARIINPNLDQEKMLKAAIAQNPELLQTLINNESLNPGALESLGFGRVAQSIAGMQPDPAVINERKVQADIAERMKDPKFAADVTSRRALGMTQTGREQEDVNLALSREDLKERPVISATNLARLRQMEIETRGLQATEEMRGVAEDYYKANPKESPRSLAAKIINGTIDPRVASAIKMNNPAVQSAIEKIMQDERIAAERDMMNLRLSNEGREGAKEKYHQMTVARYLQEMDNPNITYDMMDQYLRDPNLQVRARSLLGKDPATLNPQDRMLQEIQLSYTNLDRTKKSRLSMSASRVITNAARELRIAVDKAKEDGLGEAEVQGIANIHIASIQSALGELGAAQGKNYTVEFLTEIPEAKGVIQKIFKLSGPYGIAFKDADTGEIININEVTKAQPEAMAGDLVEMALEAKKSGVSFADIQKNPAWAKMTPEQQNRVSTAYGQKKEQPQKAPEQAKPKQEIPKPIPPAPPKDTTDYPGIAKRYHEELKKGRGVAKYPKDVPNTAAAHQRMDVELRKLKEQEREKAVLAIPEPQEDPSIKVQGGKSMKAKELGRIYAKEGIKLKAGEVTGTEFKAIEAWRQYWKKVEETKKNEFSYTR